MDETLAARVANHVILTLAARLASVAAIPLLAWVLASVVSHSTDIALIKLSQEQGRDRGNETRQRVIDVQKDIVDLKVIIAQEGGKTNTELDDHERRLQRLESPRPR